MRHGSLQLLSYRRTGSPSCDACIIAKAVKSRVSAVAFNGIRSGEHALQLPALLERTSERVSRRNYSKLALRFMTFSMPKPNSRKTILTP